MTLTTWAFVQQNHQSYFFSREGWPLLSCKYFTFHPQRLSFGEFALTDFRHHWICERFKCCISYLGGGGTLGPIFPLTDWQNVDCLTEVDRPTQLICIWTSSFINIQTQKTDRQKVAPSSTQIEVQQNTHLSIQMFMHTHFHIYSILSTNNMWYVCMYIIEII